MYVFDKSGLQYCWLHLLVITNHFPNFCDIFVESRGKIPHVKMYDESRDIYNK